jgi:hypothetical protein
MSKLVTIPGFKKMSKQRIFNLAVAQIAKTRVPSLNKEGNCAYAGSGCNAAPLIQPSKRTAMDKLGSWDELVDKGYAPANNADFIEQLQAAHDRASNHGSAFMEIWKDKMYTLANKYNLSVSTLHKVVL